MAVTTTPLTTTPLLTEKERAAVQQLAAGRRVPEIARKLGISEEAVRSRIDAARAKLHAREAPALVHAAYQHQVLDVPSATRATPTLPESERELLPLLAKGLDLTQMAAVLRRPLPAVRRTLRSLRMQLGAQNPAHAVSRAWHLRLFTHPAARDHAIPQRLPAPPRRGAPRG
jgi:DNA-binding NarL/FixJ family response regulator